MKNLILTLVSLFGIYMGTAQENSLSTSDKAAILKVFDDQQ